MTNHNSMQHIDLGKSRDRGPGWWRQRVCNPLPYHLAMPPVAALPEDLTPVEPMTSELYPPGGLCAKCGGFFLSHIPQPYSLWGGRDALLCLRCAASGLVSGSVPVTEENRHTAEEAAWRLLGPQKAQETEDDFGLLDWLLHSIERNEGNAGLDRWAAAAEEHVRRRGEGAR